MKTQNVRLLDVFLIGPLTFLAGRRLADEGSPVQGGLLMLFGTATVAYNAANYMTVARQGVIPGGIAAGKKFPIDPAELRRGIKVEMEHTTDPEVAEEIARDHLYEHPKYYTKLLKAGL